MEFFRRLTIPYYEEARHYLPLAVADGELEGWIIDYAYAPDVLKRIIKHYAPRKVVTTAEWYRKPAPALRVVARRTADDQEA